MTLLRELSQQFGQETRLSFNIVAINLGADHEGVLT